MKSRSTNGGLVYSTDAGRMCPVCRQPVAKCVCKAAPQTKVPSDGVVRVSRETKGRAGKGGVIEVQGDHCDRVIELLKAQGMVVKRAGG